MNSPLIVVIDGMGGGIGKSVVEKLCNEKIRLVALGTNSYATNQMLNAGAHEGYTGQENIISYIEKADVIIGVIGILIPDGMKGEFSADIVLSICKSSAVKILIPMNRCGIKVATHEKSLSHHIDDAIDLAREEIENLNHEG
ncbi:MAG: DUF3842 family protein [Clostridia bacterium]